MQTSLPICRLIYISDQVKGLRVWGRQWRQYRRGSSFEDDIFKGDTTFKRLLEGVTLI